MRSEKVYRELLSDGYSELSVVRVHDGVAYLEAALCKNDEHNSVHVLDSRYGGCDLEELVASARAQAEELLSLRSRVGL